MPSNEKPVLVAIIGAMGLIIAALITSGYFHRTSAAKRENVLEERVRILEEELRRQQSAAQAKAQASESHQPSSRPSVTAAEPIPALQNSRDLGAVAISLARNENAQILAAGASATGMLAENATKTYVFLGTANVPLLFTLNQPNRNFWLRFEILDPHGNPLVRDKVFSDRSTDYPFTPPKDDAYVLRITGYMGYGNYVLMVKPLDNGASNP